MNKFFPNRPRRNASAGSPAAAAQSGAGQGKASIGHAPIGNSGSKPKDRAEPSAFDGARRYAPEPLMPEGYGIPADFEDGAPFDAYSEARMAPGRQTTAAAPQHGKDWLTVREVRKSFKKRMVVRGVSLAVRRGEAVGLLGPNGAGKTTVFYMVTGLIPADDGQILIDGNNVTRLPMYRRARLGIGYLPQEASIFRGMTVEQNILAVLELFEPNRKRQKEQLDALLEEFDIARLRKSPSIALSGGERRRCEIARSLASRPSYVLLDEPFAGVDPVAVNEIKNLVRQLTSQNIGVLITDHNVRETLSLVDRAYIIYDGQVLTQGKPDDIIQDEEVRRVYLGNTFDS